MTATPTGYVTVVWDAKAKAGREADLKAFITAAVTPSRNDPGNIDYEAHEIEADPANSSSTNAGRHAPTSTPTSLHPGCGNSYRRCSN